MILTAKHFVTFGVAAIFLATVVVTCSAEVLSCGGFVKSLDVPIDYTKLQVKLLTAEGNLKFEGEFNPANGYYMIPVYNRGDYVIRLFAPDGWFFEPSSVGIKVDGKTDPCSRDEDINFVLTYFAVEGMLRSGDRTGPADILLTLSSEDGIVIAETKTTSNGAYRFKAPPGKYMVSTSNESTECIERNKVPVEVIASPVRVTPDLKISGHLLSVVVFSKKVQVAGAYVSLFSDVDVKLPYCGKTHENENSDEIDTNEKLVCNIKTDDKGIARFPCLPPATYTIYPSLSTSKVRFNFLPKSRKITMGSTAEKVAFDMLGFSSKGQVLSGSRPVPDADVYLNDELKTKSDFNGWYVLDGLQEGSYVITARKGHYVFNTVNVKLSAEKAEIPDITASSVDICVRLNAEAGRDLVMPIEFKNKRKGMIRVVSTDNSGRICVKAVPGSYSISVQNPVGVVMMPKRRELDVSEEPVLDVSFSQFKANVNVAVKCLEECTMLKVELWKDKELIKAVDGTDRYSFYDIPPDYYTLKIVDNGRYCWKKAEQLLVIDNTDRNDVTFVQTGYGMMLRTSHIATLKWSMINNPQISGSLELMSGESSFCVPVAGIYTLQFDACYKFDKPSYEVSVPQETPLIVTAVKFLVSASVRFNDGKVHREDIKLIMNSKNDVQVIPAANANEGLLTFPLYLSAVDNGAEITLTPQSLIYLFMPASHVFRFEGKCHLKEVTFVAHKGLFIEGKVVPPVEGVFIRVSHRSDNNTVLFANTNAQGYFRVGPVRRIMDFEITAEKNGYKFEKTQDFGVLHASKLSQLIIMASDAETGKPLPSVLISLSGVDNYRSSSLLDKTGQIIFVGLHSGEYFLQPILQEYRFEPKSVTVSVREGEFESVNLKGRRFAFSVFGRVSFPAGQPVQSVIVEAVSEECSQLQEEDITNENGDYRIRGLHPNCTYHLILKSQDGRRLQSYPTHYTLMVQSDDIKEIDFALIQLAEQVEIAGDVVFVGMKPLRRYRIVLCNGGSALQHVTVNAPSTVFYFDVPYMDNIEYSVRFESFSTTAGQRLESKEAYFIANETFKTVTLVVTPQRKFEVEISCGSYFALPFVLLIAYTFFNHQKAFVLLENIFSHLSNISQRNSPSSENYTESVKRRQKVKKVQ